MIDLIVLIVLACLIVFTLFSTACYLIIAHKENNALLKRIKELKAEARE